MTSLIVAKFGGTSMGSGEALRNAARILKADPAARLVVVSATSGTTNQLISLCEAEFAGHEAAGSQLAKQIKERHEDLASAVSIRVPEFAFLFAEMDFLQRSIRDARATGLRQSAKLLDQLLSLGERLSSEIFSCLLRAEGRNASCFDVRRVLRTDSHFGKAEPEISTIAALAAEHLASELERTELLVTQGFIGATSSGDTTTLGRGGSDFSAALLGEALKAEAVQIWTDVPGVFTMDPNVVREARLISELSFPEASELANFGAKVLHPSTLSSAMRAGVPVYVGSTFQAGVGGTWVRSESTNSPMVRAIALRRKQTLITVNSLGMLNAQGYLARMFQVLADHNLSVDLVTTSEVSVALTIDIASQGSGVRPILENQELLNELRSFAEITIEEDYTLVSVIGNRIASTPGVGLRALKSIGPHNVRLLCHGASDHSFCFLVDPASANEVAFRLHGEFIGGVQ